MRQHRARAPDGFPVPGQAMAGGLRVRITPSSPAWAWVRARAARLTLANALVTLNFTMWGITTERFKTGLILVVATVTLCLAWFFLPHFSFVVFVACVSAAGLFMLCRDAWRQVHRVDPPPPQPRAVARARGRRFRGAEARAQRRGEVLHPAATVTLSDERATAGVDDVFADLDRELVGLLPVKKKVEEIAALLLVDRVRQRFGLTAPRPNLHMCFTGEPGTGKTTVALRMADLLHRLGYLESGHLVHAMRNDLVGEFIGHTAPKTRRVLDRAMGGVLFIDEAYYLYRASDSRDYGQECIDILLQVMENDRDKLVVILAGYKDRMDEFFECNPGMSSRIAHHIDFAPYQLDELMAIGQAMLGQASYYLSDQAEAVFREYLTFQMGQPRFANARSVRNELERARLRHAHRLAANPQLSRSRDDLMRLEPLDILTSPVFSLSAIDE